MSVPAPEPGAGKTVFMTLLDENTVHLRLGEPSAANPETWIRCSPSISALRVAAAVLERARLFHRRRHPR